MRPTPLPPTAQLPFPPYSALPFATPPLSTLTPVFPSYLFEVKAGPASSSSQPSAVLSSPQVKFESTVAAWGAQKEVVAGLGGSGSGVKQRRRRKREVWGVLATLAVVLGVVLLSWTRAGGRFRWAGQLETLLKETIEVKDTPTRIVVVGGERHYTFHGLSNPPPSPLPPPPLHQQLAPPTIPPPSLQGTDKFLPPLSLKPPAELLFPLSRPRRSSATIVLPITSLPDLEHLNETLTSLLELTSTGVILTCSSQLVEPIEEQLRLRSELESSATNATEEEPSLVLASKVLVVGWSNITFPPPTSPEAVHDQSHALPLIHLLVNHQPSLNNQTFLILPALSSLPLPSSLPSLLRPLLSYPIKRSHIQIRPPLFLHGARLTASELLPVSSEGDELIPVAFGVPPMLIGSKVLRASVEGMRLTEGGEMGVWAALGERVVVVIGGGEEGGVGGWVVPPPHHHRHGTPLAPSSPSASTMEEIVRYQLPSISNRSSSRAHQSLHLALFSPTPLSDRGRVGLVLPSLEALDVLGPLACALLRTGHQIDIRVPSLEEEEKGEVVGWRAGCWLRYRGGREEESGTRTRRKGGVDVVIVGGEGLEGEVIGLGMEGGVRIVVPERDLVEGRGGGEIWDWVGTLGISSLKNWHTPNIQLSIITSSRPISLLRLLTALQNAHYLSPNPIIPLSISLERNSSPETLAVVRDLDWSRNGGQVNVRHRVKQGGVLLAVTESWYPKDEHDYGVLLEDDVELSPFFFAWLKWTILKYRYGPEGKEGSGGMFGVSLYQQKNNELRMEGRRPFDAKALMESVGEVGESPYLSAVPCSWGAVYFPETWIGFHTYLSHRLLSISPRPSSRETDPSLSPNSSTSPFQILPDSRSSNWTSSWKRYFIDYLHLTSPSMSLYPNFSANFSLSTNHLEPGAHVLPPPSSPTPSNANSTNDGLGAVSEEWESYLRKKESFEVPLIQAGMGGLTGFGMPGGRLPEWKSLRRVDFFGRVVEGGDEELRERGEEARRRVEKDCLQGGGKWELVMDGLVCLEEGGSTMKNGKSGKGRKKRTRTKKVLLVGDSDGIGAGREFDAEDLTREVVKTGIWWRVKFGREVW